MIPPLYGDQCRLSRPHICLAAAFQRRQDPRLDERHLHSPRREQYCIARAEVIGAMGQETGEYESHSSSRFTVGLRARSGNVCPPRHAEQSIALLADWDQHNWSPPRQRYRSPRDLGVSQALRDRGARDRRMRGSRYCIAQRNRCQRSPSRASGSDPWGRAADLWSLVHPSGGRLGDSLIGSDGHETGQLGLTASGSLIGQIETG